MDTRTGAALVRKDDFIERQRLAGLDAELCIAEYNGTLRPYRLFVPSSYQYVPVAPGEEVPEFPLVVMLHGGGSADYPCDENWYFANKETPERIQTIAEERGYILACPALPFTLVWHDDPGERERMLKRISEQDVSFVEAVIEEVTYSHHVDEGRIYLTGASRGGGALYAAVSANPDKYAAIAPVCTAPAPEWLDGIAKVPTLILHAVEDAIFPIEKARELKRKLADRGCDVKMQEFPGGHDGLRNMKAYGMIFDWFDAHHRESKE